LLSFAQQAALQEMTPQPPVAAGPASVSWLVREVDIRPGAEALHLTFKNATAQQVSVHFVGNALRQWLAILHHAYGAAQWPAEVWPAWMSEPSSQPQPASRLWH
jgi:hypothetical protein